MSTNPSKRNQSIYSKMHNTADILSDVDNEQLYKKIVDLLLAAGYYRARIQNLEPFDKVYILIYKLPFTTLDSWRNCLDYNRIIL